MGRKGARSTYQCPRCGTVVSAPSKTWQLVAPIPDSHGRITVTVMGIFECPNCGHKWRGVVAKLKVGSESVEMEGKKGVQQLKTEEKVERKATVIELDVSEIMSEEE